MKKTATVRIKNAKWQVLASPAGTERDDPEASIVAEDLQRRSRLVGGSAKAMLVDLAVRHFRALRPTAAEARRLAGALRRCLKGEAVDVGPIGLSGRLYNFRRKANAISIRAGDGDMRLPLDAAEALIEPLRRAVRPGMLAKAG